MKNVGACAGKFRIIHHGHLEYFIQASLLCDVVHIFLVNNDRVKRYISLDDTIKVIENIFDSLDCEYNIHVTDFKEGKEWDQYLIDTIGNDNFIIFNSKEDYENIIVKNKYLNCLSDDNISATKIENNIYEFENFNNIEKNFRSYLTKKILINNCADFLKLKNSLELTYINNRFEFINSGNYDYKIDLNKDDDMHAMYKSVVGFINNEFNIRR